jgi:hypothetical protein
MQRCGVREECKGGKILFASTLRHGLEQAVAYAESTSRFLMPYVVG